MLPKLNSAHGSETRNIINRAIEVLNVQGKTIQDLVAEGQLTPQQYANLITIVNGNIKSGDVDKYDLTPELRSEVDKVRNKIDKGEVSVHDINKNKGKLDGTYFSSDFLQQLNGGIINTTEIVPRSVTTDKIEDKSVTPGKVSFIEIPEGNMVNKDKLRQGYYIDAEGNIHAADNFYLMDFTEVTPGETISFTGFSRVNYYDADKTPTGTYEIHHTETGTVTIPDGSYYITGNAVDASFNSNRIQMNKGNQLLPYEDYKRPTLTGVDVPVELEEKQVKKYNIDDEAVGVEQVDFIEKSSNLINLQTLTPNYHIDDQGNFVENNTVSYTELIKVENGETYAFNDVFRVVKYDESKNIISRTEDLRDTDGLVVMDGDTQFIRVLLLNDYIDSGNRDIQMNKGSVLLPYEPYYEDFKYKKPREQGEELTPQSKSSVSLLDDLYTAPVMEDRSQNTVNPLRSNDVAEIYGLYDDLVSRFPQYVSRSLVKNDAEGTPIYRYDFRPEDVPTEDNWYPKILILTGTHGDERAAVWSQYQMFRILCEEWDNSPITEKLRFNTHYVVIPMVNPWGYDNNQRKTINGVDVLRNFPRIFEHSNANPDSNTYRGPEPLSEIETQAVWSVYQEGGWSYVTDHHNRRGDELTEYYFLWIPRTSIHSNYVAQKFIRQMTNKWIKEHDYFPKETTKPLGYSDVNLNGIYYEAFRDGVPAHLFETSQMIPLAPNNVYHSSEALTLGVESTMNWFYMVYLNYCQ